MGNLDAKYIYDDGFGPKYFICNQCGGPHLVRKHQGGFTPPKYKCDNCGFISAAPRWEHIVDEEQLKLQKRWEEAVKMDRIQFELVNSFRREIMFHDLHLN